MSKTLRLAAAFTLPSSVFTQVVALLAKRGAGKTHSAAVLVEEFVAVGGQVVILDPVGAWWGLRAAAGGDAPGLPFAVFGGDHPDLPLTPDMGSAAADLAVDEQVLLVFDLSAFDSKAEQNRFVTDFANRLYRRNRMPLHLVLEEADEFAPERGLPGERQMLGSVQRLVRRGRTRGIGITMITQRSAAVSKGVLTQADILIALRTTAPHDQRAIGEWIQAKGVDDQRDEVMSTLSGLPTGTGWVWAPEMDILKKVHFRARRTFDSSSTPQLGHVISQPVVFADIDLDALRARLSPTYAAAVAEETPSPSLQTENEQLQRRLLSVQTELDRLRAAPPTVVVERVPVVDHLLRDSVDRVLHQLTSAAAELREALDRTATPAKTVEASSNSHPANPSAAAPQTFPPAVAHHSRSTDGNGALGKAQRMILSALAPYPQGRSKTQIALLTRYSARGGGFNNALSALRTAGMINGSGSTISATAAGLAALGPFTPLPTGEALQVHWSAQLGRAPRLILEALCAAWPATLTKTEVAVACRYEPGGGGFNNALSKLRTLDLVTGTATALRASDTLFDF